MACEYADPARDDHDHAAVCLRDDESYAAELLLRVAAAAANGDDTATLDAVTDLMDAAGEDGSGRR